MAVFMDVAKFQSNLNNLKPSDKSLILWQKSMIGKSYTGNLKVTDFQNIPTEDLILAYYNANELYGEIEASIQDISHMSDSIKEVPRVCMKRRLL